MFRPTLFDSRKVIARKVAMAARWRRQGKPKAFVSGCIGPIGPRSVYCHLLSVPPATIAIGPGLIFEIDRVCSAPANARRA